MTSLVAIRCKDGVVIGSDSSATFGDGSYVRTIEQTTDRKIEIVGNTNKIIIAGTGFTGHHQRFVEAVKMANARKEFENKTEIEVAKELARGGVNDFGSTTQGAHMDKIPYSAFVAYRVANKASLCELVGNIGFQPEMKRPDDLWFSSLGSGQPITDPFLALFRSIFWSKEAPDVKGGIFTAYWALQHACTVNPGGVNFPIKIAVYSLRKGSLEPWMLSDDELAETKDLVQAATDHFAGFRDLLLGRTGTVTPPPPPGKPSA
jgi:ATP-dependent protease HslVU (ClpYQ) peptidase subunit